MLRSSLAGVRGYRLRVGFDTAQKDLIFFQTVTTNLNCVARIGSSFFPHMNRADTSTIVASETLILQCDYSMPGLERLVDWLFGYTAEDVGLAFDSTHQQVWEGVTVRQRHELQCRICNWGFAASRFPAACQDPVHSFPRAVGTTAGAKRPHSHIARVLPDLVDARPRLHWPAIPRVALSRPIYQVLASSGLKSPDADSCRVPQHGPINGGPIGARMASCLRRRFLKHFSDYAALSPHPLVRACRVG